MKRRILKSLTCLLLMIALLSAPTSALAASKAYLVKVNADWSRFHSREYTAVNGYSYTNLRKGTKLLYWGEKAKDNKSMYKVLNSSGKIGYVYKGLLTAYGAMRKDQIRITSTKTKLYKLSNNKLKSNGTLAKGKYVVVYKSSGNWAYIKTMTGKSAYCKLSDLKKAF